MQDIFEGILNSLTKSAKDLRKRVDVFIYNDKGQVYAEPSMYRGTLRFPGGGVDEGLSINESARGEALEEAGLTTGRIQTVGKPKTILWSENVKRRNENRGRFFDGNRQYFRAAPVTGKNKELLGSEGDALKNGQWFDIDKAIATLEAHGRTGDDFSNLSAAEAKALKTLRDRIK